jgi:hypothetical protein
MQIKIINLDITELLMHLIFWDMKNIVQYINSKLINFYIKS